MAPAVPATVVRLKVPGVKPAAAVVALARVRDPVLVTDTLPPPTSWIPLTLRLAAPPVRTTVGV